MFAITQDGANLLHALKALLDSLRLLDRIKNAVRAFRRF